MSEMILVVDCETTGLDPATSAVVEIATVLVRGGALVSEWQSLVWPGREFLKRSHRMLLAKVSGIDPLELLDAPTMAECCDDWRSWLRNILGNPPYRCMSYNTEFDRGHLRNTPFDLLLRWDGCLMQRAADLMGDAGALPWDYRRNAYRWPRLEAACLHFGVRFDPAEQHRALADARAAARLMLAMDAEEARRGAAGGVR